MFECTLRISAIYLLTLLLHVAQAGGTDLFLWMLVLVAGSQQLLSFGIDGDLYQHPYCFLPYLHPHSLFWDFSKTRVLREQVLSVGAHDCAWYIASESPPLERMCNWKLYKALVVGLSPQLGLAAEIHLFTFFSTFFFILFNVS